MSDSDVCWLCGHLLSKHPRPKRLLSMNDWDYFKHHCFALTCQCPLSRFGQLLNDKGVPVAQPERGVMIDVLHDDNKKEN